MIERRGIAVSPGVVIAEAFVLDREDVSINQRFVTAETMPDEIGRLERATEAACEEINELQEKANQEIGPGSAAIFEAHSWILRDPEFLKEVCDRIEFNHFTAEYAIDRAMRKYINKLKSSGVRYFRERVSDFEDIERRLINHLQGERGQDLAHLDRTVVLVAHDLTPSQTISLDRTKILAFVTDTGGRTSHTAILARDLGIPAVVGLGDLTSEVSPGDTVIVDGNHGVVIVSPDVETRDEYDSQRQIFAQFSAGLHKELDLPAVTTDGVHVEIVGNIEFPLEIEDVLKNGGAGIGLYRTEFLFLEAGHLPDEDEHLQAYKKAIELLQGRPITIRTFDLGADKLFPSSEAFHRERNPFLGCRSIRTCQAHPEIFRPQVRAILRASTLGTVQMMLPMITTLDEVRWAKAIMAEVKNELTREHLPFNAELPMGIMIEVPAAALIAEELAEEVDFFSIGTNDLIQYTLAVDRTNEIVAPLFMPAHPAVVRLLERVIAAGAARDIPVSICGEMAGEPVYTVLLLGLGLRTFSVAAAMMPEIKKIIRSISVAEAERIGEHVRQQSDPATIVAYLTEQTHRILPGAIL